MDRINAVEGISPPVAEHKADIYFSRPGEKKHFRVRLQDAYVIITSKTKGKAARSHRGQPRDRVQHQCRKLPSGAGVFLFLGFCGTYSQGKDRLAVVAWQDRSGTCAGRPLGWFVEMEIVLGDDVSDAEVLQAKSELFELIGKLV